MITVSIGHLIFMFIGALILVVILCIIDYMKNRPFVSRQERELKDLLYTIFNVRWYTGQERSLQFKWCMIFLFIVSLLYGILFKIPIPFVGKPLCVLEIV